MVLLPGDYDRGTDGTTHKPPLYVMVKVIKFLPDRPDLCVEERKMGGFMKIQPYHPNGNKELVRLRESHWRLKKGCGATTQMRLRLNWVCIRLLTSPAVHSS